MREHPDPTPMVTGALRGFFAHPSNVGLFGGEVIVAAEDVPDDWQLLTSAPLITVHDDGGPEQWPVKRDVTVRVTARARGVPLAKRVASRANGFLHDNRPTGLAALSDNGAGFVIARDSDTGADLASFTVTAVVATIQTV